MLGSFVIRGKKIQFSLSAVFNVVFFFFYMCNAQRPSLSY